MDYDANSYELSFLCENKKIQFFHEKIASDTLISHCRSLILLKQIKPSRWEIGEHGILWQAIYHFVMYFKWWILFEGHVI